MKNKMITKQSILYLIILFLLTSVGLSVLHLKSREISDLQQKNKTTTESLKVKEEESDSIKNELKKLSNPSINLVGNFKTVRHETSGKVELTKNNNKTTLKIKDLKTDQGPDLKIIVTTQDEKNWKKEFFKIADLKEFSGSFEYRIPEIINTSNIKSVLIWCEEHDSLFGVANLSVNN